MQSVNSSPENGGTEQQAEACRSIPDPDIQKAARAMRLRLLSALVLAPMALAAVFFGSPALEIVMSLAVVAMAWEWARLCNQGEGIARVILLVLATLAVLEAGIFGFYWWSVGAAAVGTVLTFAFLLVRRYWGRRYPHKKALVGRVGEGAAFWTSMGVVWIAAPSLAFLWLRDLPETGQHTAIWIIAVVWATDTGAFFAGRSLGGPKLAPKISPNKTWSGLIGGMLAAMLVGWIASYLGEGLVHAGRMVIASACLAILAQIGDLGESWIKRRFGAKDSGRLIPGHGGMLDRLDGFLAAAAAAGLASWLLGESIYTWQ